MNCFQALLSISTCAATPRCPAPPPAPPTASPASATPTCPAAARARPPPSSATTCPTSCSPWVGPAEYFNIATCPPSQLFFGPSHESYNPRCPPCNFRQESQPIHAGFWKTEIRRRQNYTTRRARMSIRGNAQKFFEGAQKNTRARLHSRKCPKVWKQIPEILASPYSWATPRRGCLRSSTRTKPCVARW